MMRHREFAIFSELHLVHVTSIFFAIDMLRHVIIEEKFCSRSRIYHFVLVFPSRRKTESWIEVLVRWLKDPLSSYAPTLVLLSLSCSPFFFMHRIGIAETKNIVFSTVKKKTTSLTGERNQSDFLLGRVLNMQFNYM